MPNLGSYMALSTFMKKAPPNTRKVKFRILSSAEFDPEKSDEENAEEYAKEEYQEGFFHTWTEAESKGITTERDSIQKVALVENPEDGTMYYIEPYNLIFVDYQDYEE